MLTVIQIIGATAFMFCAINSLVNNKASEAIIALILVLAIIVI